MQRRTFLAGAAVAGLAATGPVAAAATPGTGPGADGAPDPADYLAATEALRRQYWTQAPEVLLPQVAWHARTGAALIGRGTYRRLAPAVAETALLAFRLSFFDLRQGEAQSLSWHRLALDAADAAGDDTLAAAVLGHSAFPPAWAGRADEARGALDAARKRARNGAPSVLTAWLDAIAAEAEGRLGEPDGAFALLDRSAAVLDRGETGAWSGSSPAWFDWFSTARLAGFRGGALVAAGRGGQARGTLEGVLTQLPAKAGKQRAVVYADLAAAAVADNEVDGACGDLDRALDELERQRYATGMERVREVRQRMNRWAETAVVRGLDERLRSLAAAAAG